MSGNLERVARAIRELRTEQQGLCLAIEAKCFLSLLADFHEDMCNPEREHLFWIKMVKVRSEYVEQLEKLQG